METRAKRPLTAVILRVAVTAALVAVAVVAFDWHPIAAALAGADPSWIAAAFAAYLLAAVAMAERWRRMLATDAASLPLLACIRIYLECFLVGLALPSFLGGDAYRAVRARRHVGGTARVAVNVIAERLIGFTALFALGALGIAIYPIAGWSPGARALVVVAVVAAGLVGVAIVRRIDRLAAYVEQARAYLHPPRCGASLLALSTTAHVLGAASVYFTGLAVGIELAFPFYLVLLPGLWLLSLVPALGGIGPKEGGLIVALTGTGVAEETAVAAAALVLASRLFASALGGVSLVVGSKDRP
jgi:hypothetical protein